MYLQEQSTKKNISQYISIGQGSQILNHIWNNAKSSCCYKREHCFHASLSVCVNANHKLPFLFQVFTIIPLLPEHSPTVPVKPGFHDFFGRKRCLIHNCKTKTLLSQSIPLHVNSHKKNSNATLQHRGRDGPGLPWEILPNQNNSALFILLRQRASAKHHFKPGLSNQWHMQNAGNDL